MGRRFIKALEHPHHLSKLIHQVALVMEPSRRIRQHHVRPPGAGGGHRVKEHGRAIGALPLGDHRYVGAGAPLLELLHRRGAKGIAGGQEGTVPGRLEALGQLADGGGFTHAIDSDHKNHIGLGGREGKGYVARAEDFREHLRQLAHERVFVVQGPALHPRR